MMQPTGLISGKLLWLKKKLAKEKIILKKTIQPNSTTR